MTSKNKRGAIAVTALSIAALGLTGVADAAKHRHRRGTTNSTGSSSTRPANPETELSGDTATRARAAALSATGGGTVWRASIENPGDASGAAYEVHVTKTDGSEVEVLERSDYSIVAINASRQHGGDHGGPGGRGGPSNEDATHEAGESAQREAQENANQSGTTTTTTTSSTTSG